MNTTTKQKNVVTIVEAANILGKKPMEVRKMISVGEIPCFKTPKGHYRILMADLLKIKKQGMTNEKKSEILTPEQASKMLGVSRPTVTQMAKEGMLPYTETPGGHHRILREDVERYVARSRAKARLRAVLTLERLKKKAAPAVEEKQDGESKSP